MKRGLYIIALSSLIHADDASLQKVVVEEKINTQIIKEVSSEEIKSADLADALQKNIPSINIIRRSGIANDILLRGQKRDNINIIIDGTKVCGACVNRMDPPTSHVLTNYINTVQVTEGPFDVENFGTLSGIVNIQTKKPTQKIEGDMSVNVGSFGYQKMAGSISGGSDKIRLLLLGSTEKGDQYKDGNGDTLAQQVINATEGKPSAGAQYQPRYQDMDAFTKSTLTGKIFVDLSENQELRASYTANRSDDVLYPSSKMDALYDDSDIYNLEYILSNLSTYSKSLHLQLYQSTVDHPMSTIYRKMGAVNYKTHALTTDMKGAKIKNSFTIRDIDLTVGLDHSKRNWDGHFDLNGTAMKMPNGMLVPKSLDDVDTTNNAIFIKADQKYHHSDIHYGLRYDHTRVESASQKEPDNHYHALSANIFATLHQNDRLSYFAGIGKSSRVPDPRELYLLMMGKHFGTPNLKQTSNYELDLGFEKIYDRFSIKTKAYYSALKDYIAFNASKEKNNFENVDANIYGIEISGDYMALDNLYLDYGFSYKRGEKSHPLSGQTGTNLPDMRPFKANLALNYDYDDANSAKIEFIGATHWDEIDAENGEQKLAGYGIVNLKLSHTFAHHITVTGGVDNLFDKNYAITNTYRDLTLLTTGASVDDVMLLNEPGRYFYANVSYKF